MYVHVYSGLMSRCITLAHAYYLLKNRGGQEKLIIVWPVDIDCGIHFKEVFADDIFSDVDLTVIEDDTKYLRSGGVWLNIRKGSCKKAISIAVMKIRGCVIKRLPAIVFGKNYFDYEPLKELGWSGTRYREHLVNTWNKVKKALSDHKKVYIHAYCGIIKDAEQEKVDVSVIKFRDEYWKKVEELVGLEEKCIGIHIRRTDHQVAIKGSSTKAFINKIDEIVEKEKDIKFFLATDDMDEEKTLKQIYGEKIITQPDKKWGRGSSKEMQSGIIDCLCLSCCKYIVGSCGSVFSAFAARYGKKDLVICKEDDGN